MNKENIERVHFLILERLRTCVSEEYAQKILVLLEKAVVSDLLQNASYKDEGYFSNDEIKEAIGKWLIYKLEKNGG